MVGSLIALVAQGEPAGGGGLSILLPLLLMGGIFYFLLIRPQQRRQRQQRTLIESLEPGDEVVTVGGLYGVVREVDDRDVVLRVASGVELKFVKSAIGRKIVSEDEIEGSGRDEEAGEQP